MTKDIIASTFIHYDFNFSRFKQHLVDVTLSFTASNDAPTLWLPAWIPGSYLIREFARNITAVHYEAQTEASHNQSATLEPKKRGNKISKNEWQLADIKAGEAVSVNYEVYCYDLSVRTAYVDQTRLYGNFTSLALAVEGQEDTPIHVTLSVPQTFFDGLRDINPDRRGDKVDYDDKVNTVGHSKDNTSIKFVCGLPHTHMKTDVIQQYGLQVPNYAELIDYPFELSLETEFDFIIHDNEHQSLPHRFYISGKHSANMGRLQMDITHICQTYLHWLGEAPFKAYTFMTYASGNDYGGLEHINSTSLVTPRSDLPTADEASEPSDAYQRYLGLCSHEYFHAWWVKTVRPDVMIDVNLKEEAYTPLLWVFEGFTSYIDDFMLQASGVVSQESYLKLLAAQINRYSQTPGRHQQSVAESSFDAWIKLYRTDENTGNAGISYYNKGALVALCLDLLLLKETDAKYRIFDIVKAYYSQAKQHHSKRIGMTDANLSDVIAEFMDIQVWQRFVNDYVTGTKELPIAELLEAQGIDIQTTEKDNSLPWGITVKESLEGLTVSKVLRDSVASEAGLSAKDIVIAIDGVKASQKQLQLVAKSQLGEITCHAFRRDELMVFKIPNETQTKVSANPSLEKIELTLSEGGFEDWLTPRFIK